jgi:hypothetical protein
VQSRNRLFIFFLGGGRGVLPFTDGKLYTKQKCFYFQLNLIPSTYSVIVLSSFGILRWEFDFLSFFISIDIALIAC